MLVEKTVHGCESWSGFSYFLLPLRSNQRHPALTHTAVRGPAIPNGARGPTGATKRSSAGKNPKLKKDASGICFPQLLHIVK